MSWNAATLGEIAERDGGLIQTGPFGSQLHQSDYVSDGIPVIMPKDITEGRVDTTSVARVSEETANRLSRHQLRPRTIVLPRRGEITKRAFIRDDQAGWLCGTGCLQIALEGRHLLPEFLYYYMEQEGIVRWLEQHAVGTTMLNLSATIVTELPLKYPMLTAQERIAGILSAYDDLIENNRRRMALLEEGARQLYREWFVRLRFPGYEHTRITDGVPGGWGRHSFVEACSSLEDGDWIETKDQGGDDYRLLQISNIGINEFVETGNFRYITEQTFKRLNCRELLPGHILIARMPKPIGRAWLVTEMPWRLITAVDAAIAVANEELADAYFLTHYLNSPASLEHCERRAVGATRPRIARRELAALPLLLPPRRLQTHFREFAEPLNQQRVVLYRQNEKLRAARDLLLPRLMSGQVAV
jgi:type I restriction enzyme S subunit